MASLTLALALFACGGAGGGKTDSGPSPTKAQFLEKGNAICAQAHQEIEKVYGPYTKKPRPDALLNRLSQELVIPATRHSNWSSTTASKSVRWDSCAAT